jgi:hypothetical protein
MIGPMRVKGFSMTGHRHRTGCTRGSPKLINLPDQPIVPIYNHAQKDYAQKEPTQAPKADSTQIQASKTMATTSHAYPLPANVCQITFLVISKLTCESQVKTGHHAL